MCLFLFKRGRSIPVLRDSTSQPKRSCSGTRRRPHGYRLPLAGRIDGELCMIHTAVVDSCDSSLVVAFSRLFLWWIPGVVCTFGKRTGTVPSF